MDLRRRYLDIYHQSKVESRRKHRLARASLVLQTGEIVLGGPAKELQVNEQVRKAYLGEE